MYKICIFEYLLISMSNRLIQHIRRQANLALADEYRLFLVKLPSPLQVFIPAVIDRPCSEPVFTCKVCCYLSTCELRLFSCPNNSISLCK